MATARHRVSGVVVSGDEATLRRLSPEWEQVEQKKAPARRSPKKSDDEK